MRMRQCKRNETIRKSIRIANRTGRSGAVRNSNFSVVYVCVCVNTYTADVHGEQGDAIAVSCCVYFNTPVLSVVL